MARSSVKGKVRAGGHPSCILLIADILRTSEKTVNVHRSRVMQKMQVHWMAHLVRLAKKPGPTVPQGLLPMDQSPMSSASLP